jgi:hypothetical protein
MVLKILSLFELVVQKLMTTALLFSAKFVF